MVFWQTSSQRTKQPVQVAKPETTCAPNDPNQVEARIAKQFLENCNLRETIKAKNRLIAKKNTIIDAKDALIYAYNERYKADEFAKTYYADSLAVLLDGSDEEPLDDDALSAALARYAPGPPSA